MPARHSQTTTWLQLAVRNAGIREGLRAMNWSFRWAVTREALGHDPTADQIAEWWLESRRTTFRGQKAFRAAFPSLETPAPIYTQPELRRRMREIVKIGNDLDEKARTRRLDLEIINIGLMTATVD